VRQRDFHIPFIKLEDIKKKQFQKLSILFGQENNGLNNEEISHANFITTIPTLSSKSLNLSHSVSIVAYALTELTLKKEKILSQTQSLKSLEIEAFIDFLFNQLDKKNFTSVKSKRDKLQISIRNYLKTSNLSQNDLKSVYGITKFLAN
jgi:tRNA C32,U32 (ribose-2'-O)-methylase TrmJ